MFGGRKIIFLISFLYRISTSLNLCSFLGILIGRLKLEKGETESREETCMRPRQPEMLLQIDSRRNSKEKRKSHERIT